MEIHGFPSGHAMGSTDAAFPQPVGEEGNLLSVVQSGETEKLIGLSLQREPFVLCALSVNRRLIVINKRRH